jgi:hypothetical protein
VRNFEYGNRLAGDFCSVNISPVPILTREKEGINFIFVKLKERWKKGLEKSRALRMIRRVFLFGLGVLSASILLKLSNKDEQGR